MTEPLTLTDQERVELVARQVRALLTEHKLAGCFFVCAPAHCADAIMFDTAPWLRLKLETDHEGLTVGARMRSKLNEYRDRGLTEDEAKLMQQRDIEATISTLDFLGMQMGQFSMVILELYGQAKKHFDSVTTGERVGDAWGRKPS
jgi:hypothetical protein